jgi:hypothetical protein
MKRMRNEGKNSGNSERKGPHEKPRQIWEDFY